jgi:hypothetical protein
VRLQNWLAARARMHMHFVPASSSLLKQLERWFGELIIKLLRRDRPGRTRELSFSRPTAGAARRPRA